MLKSHDPIVSKCSKVTSPIVPKTESPIVAKTETPIVSKLVMPQQTVCHNISQETSDTQKWLETILIKQGRQIHALYQLQKSTNDGVIWIQEQMKKQNEGKIDLSAKVFSVS